MHAWCKEVYIATYIVLVKSFGKALLHYMQSCRVDICMYSMTASHHAYMHAHHAYMYIMHAYLCTNNQEVD